MSSTDKSRLEIDTGISAEKVWIENYSSDSEQKVLITISSLGREKTLLLNDGVVVETKAKLFVRTPPERIVTKKQIYLRNANNLLRGLGYGLSFNRLNGTSNETWGYRNYCASYNCDAAYRLHGCI